MFLASLGGGVLHWSGLSTELQLTGFGTGGVFLVYLTWRWTAAFRRFERFNQVQQHRAELDDWVRERRNTMIKKVAEQSKQAE